MFSEQQVKKAKLRCWGLWADLDVVFVHTTDPFRAPVALDALPYDKYFFAEKLPKLVAEEPVADEFAARRRCPCKACVSN